MACCKQKRHMSSGSIQEPKTWSSRHGANRLTTLNRFLQYLPGTAAAINEEELKDMLVDLHSPTYQHLMARANNYEMDNQSYLQVTQYLQNLSLIEESFNKASSHNIMATTRQKRTKWAISSVRASTGRTTVGSILMENTCGQIVMITQNSRTTRAIGTTRARHLRSGSAKHEHRHGCRYESGTTDSATE